MAEKNYFYELGRKSGAKTGFRKSGAQALVDKLSTSVDSMLKEQQTKTASLMADMPQGIDILKVDERIRGKVTEMLTKNKKAYTDAAKVVASGINPSSQRYMDAIETMNKVNGIFENMSNSLEGIALGRKDAMDRLDNLATNADSTKMTLHHMLANGSIYDNASFNDDGTMNYLDPTTNENVKWSEYKKIGDQKFTGQNGILALQEQVMNVANKKGAKWEGFYQNYYTTQINTLFQSMGKEQVEDFIFADIEFIENYAKEKGLSVDFLKRNIQGDIAGEGKYNIVEDFKKAKLLDVKLAWDNTPKYVDPNATIGEGGWRDSGKDLAIYKGSEYWNRDNAILALDSFEAASKGEVTEFDFKDQQTYSFDPQTGEWTNGTNSWASSKQLLQSLGIASPDFLKYARGSSTETERTPEVPTIKNAPLMTDGSTYEGGITSIALEGSDDDVADRLNRSIINNSSNYKFIAYRQSKDNMDQPFSNTIMLVNGEGDAIGIDGKAYKDYSKGIRLETTGDFFDDSATSNLIDENARLINDLLKKLNIRLKPLENIVGPPQE